MYSAERKAVGGADSCSSANPLGWLTETGRRRREMGLHRTLVARVADASVVDLASNDYLGLTRHPDVVESASKAARDWGVGSTGSRLITGNTVLHELLESELSEFIGTPSALVFSSGYAANLAAVTSFADKGTLVVSDALNHASIIDACRLSRARVVVSPHRSVDAVEAALATREESRAIVVTESIYGADGVAAPLAALYGVCQRHNAVLIVDEAHGFGVRGAGGQGLLHEVGLSGLPGIVITATLSKSLGSQGGVVLGSLDARSHLINTARAFMFDTGLTPMAVAAAGASLRILRAEPWRPAATLDHAARLARACGVDGQPESAVVSVPVGDPNDAVDMADECAVRGVRVGCLRPPTVPSGTSRLRLVARASLTYDELSRATRVLSEVVRGGTCRGGRTAVVS